MFVRLNLFDVNVLPSVAVVILNWNGKKFLEQFLPSVMRSGYENLQVVVADNASTDDSVAFVSTTFPTVKIIINPENEGYAKGYNTALKQVSADYYVLLNSDVEVPSGWIAPVILRMESDSEIAACQPKVRSFAQKDYFEYAGAAGGFIDRFGYPFCRGRVFETCEEDTGQYDKAVPVFWATGACLFIRASVFHELGGFDEYFFAHQEEIDLCWRLQRAGYIVYAEPASVVYHVGGGTLPMGSRRKAYLNFRNNLVMLAKNLTTGEIASKIPARIALDTITALRGLFTGDFATFGSIIRAHGSFWGWCLSAKKKTPYPRKKMKELHGVYGRSIVKAYFLSKKHTFSKIVGKVKEM